MFNFVKIFFALIIGNCVSSFCNCCEDLCYDCCDDCCNKKKMQELEKKYNKFKNDNINKEIEFNKLNDEYQKLESDKANKEKEYNELNEKYKTLENDKANKEKEYNELNEKYKTLESEKKNLKELNGKEKNLNEKEKEKEKENERIKREKALIEKETALNKKIEEFQNFQRQKNDEFQQKKNELLGKEKLLKLKENEIEKMKKEREREKEPIIRGLKNIGATCYMNATLQALSNTYDLTEYFLKNFKCDINDKNKKISNEYFKVVKNLWDINKNKTSYSPDDFKKVLSVENPLFAGVNANDSKDLINFLIERMHKELNCVNKNINNFYVPNPNDQLNEQRMLNLFTNEFGLKYNSIISNLFYGMMETKTICQGCQNTKYNFQIYSFLEFPLEKVNSYCFNMGKRNTFNYNMNKNPDVDLYECFEYYSYMELMSGDNQMYCNICNSSNNAYYGSLLYSAPNYLIIILNRGKGAVYECKVNFPEQLNLFNFVNFKNGNTVFELYAVITHHGPSSMSGHFVAYCKNKKDKKWYLFNDEFVSLCKNSYDYQSGMPYILFYKVITS